MVPLMIRFAPAGRSVAVYRRPLSRQAWLRYSQNRNRPLPKGAWFNAEPRRLKPPPRADLSSWPTMNPADVTCLAPQNSWGAACGAGGFDETRWTVVGCGRRHRHHNRRLLEDGRYKRPSTEQRRAPSGAVGTGGAGANLNDDEFVRDVALKNMWEVEVSRLALEKARNPDIKSFAQRMVDDHGAAGQNLKTVLPADRLESSLQLDDKHRKTAGELAKKQGPDFDRAYLKAMVEGHQDLTAKLESRLDVQSLADWKRPRPAAVTAKPCPSPKWRCPTCKSAPTKVTTTSP